MPTSIAIRPPPNRMLPHQSIFACLRTPMSCSMKYAQTVPNTPTGTETRKIRCQFTGASTPPRISPMNDPAMAAIEFRPSAVPRWLAGNASVRIAVELANRNAPPMPCTMRQKISHSAAAAPCIQVTVRKIEATREDREAHVVHADPAEHVAEPAERHHQHRGDHHEAHEHPQQVAGVARAQRVQPDAAEDVGQRDQHDRLVDRRHQHAERGVRQRDPLVVRPERAGRRLGHASRLGGTRHRRKCPPPESGRVEGYARAAELACPQPTITHRSPPPHRAGLAGACAGMIAARAAPPRLPEEDLNLH